MSGFFYFLLSKVYVTVVENHNKKNIEILPQHRIYPNNSPLNLIPFPQEKPHQGMKGRNGWDLLFTVVSIYLIKVNFVVLFF
jgi:hypothetical protein